MSALSQRSFLQAQIVETKRLLALTGEHPLMSPALRQRQAALENQLRALPEAATPRTVLFFTGPPVVGSRGIDAEFAAEALKPFLEMVKTQYAASKHGEVGARGPRRDESEARLLLTGLPRGSFGLELSQPDPPDLFSAEHLSETLVRLNGVIKAAAETDEEFSVALENVSPRVLNRLRDFLQVIADRQADIRIASGELEVRLDRPKVASALDRVTNARTDEVPVELRGVFRGATLDSWRFDFRAEDGSTVSGRLGEDLTEEDVEAMDRLVNQPCLARFSRTTVTTRGGATKTRYELKELHPAPTPQ